MKILITGASGKIGRILTEDLWADNELVLVDKSEAVVGCEGADRVSARHVVDICDAGQLCSYFGGVETVIHLAGDPRTYADWPSLLNNNVLGTRNVYEAAAAGGVKRMIYASSINVFPYSRLFREGKRITVDTPVQSENPYGLSKIICETIGLDYHLARGMSVVNLRLGVVTSGDSPSSDWRGHWRQHRHVHRHWHRHGDGHRHRHRRHQDNGKINHAIWLSHGDLVRIVRAALRLDGYASLTCTSANEPPFVDLAPIQSMLGVIPVDNAGPYKPPVWHYAGLSPSASGCRSKRAVGVCSGRGNGARGC